MKEAAGDVQRLWEIIYVLGTRGPSTSLSIIENVLKQMEVCDPMCILSDTLALKEFLGNYKLKHLSRCHNGEKKKIILTLWKEKNKLPVK